MDNAISYVHTRTVELALSYNRDTSVDSRETARVCDARIVYIGSACVLRECANGSASFPFVHEECYRSHFEETHSFCRFRLLPRHSGRGQFLFSVEACALSFAGLRFGFGGGSQRKLLSPSHLMYFELHWRLNTKVVLPTHHHDLNIGSLPF